MRLSIQLVLIAAIGGGMAYGAWQLYGPTPGDGARAGSSGGGSKTVPAVVQPARFATYRRIVQAVGTGEAIKSVTLYPDVAGRITEVLFEAGDHVDKGQPLLRLDSDDERLAVQQTEAEVEELERRVARYARLSKTGAASGVALEEARTALAIARLRLARVEVALQDRTLIAPFAGHVGIAEVDPGDRVDTDTAIASLDDRSALFVDFLIPEVIAGNLSIGMPVPLSAWSHPDDKITGSVVALGSRIDPQTRRLRVRARIDNSGDHFRPGASFAINLEIAGDRYAEVPEVSVLWSRDGSHVWRITDGKAEQVFVRIVKREKGLALIDGPLSEGDLIVVEGLQSMREGQSVSHTLADPPADPTGGKAES